MVATIVEEDVAFAPENLGVPREEIRERVDNALETVGMTAFKRHAPHMLSGGQKQRVLLARALAGNSEILILDDSSSALDYKTDSMLRKALREEYSGVTTIVIAQRVSSILHADHILVLEEGKEIGYGTHEQLMESCEVYRKSASHRWEVVLMKHKNMKQYEEKMLQSLTMISHWKRSRRMPRTSKGK